MLPIRRNNAPARRNDRCPCGSQRKFKKCCGLTVAGVEPQVKTVPQFIDTGEISIRWVIVDNTGTKLFSDKDNRALVFSSKDAAFAIATLDLFSSQAPGDINVAGVGETKFKHLQKTIPYVEVEVDTAEALVRERITVGLAAIEADYPLMDDF
jgi:SEC-C motif